MYPEQQRRWASTIADDYYIFLDESGNYHFSPRGTKYLLYTAVSSGDVLAGITEMLALKHWSIACGTELEYFHATEDRQLVRDHVFNIIGKLPIRIDSILVEKAKAYPDLRPIDCLYPRVFETLITYLLNGMPRRPKRIHVFCDVPDTKKSLDAVQKAVKRTLRSMSFFYGRFECSVLVHDSKSHPYLQFADYCCWAIYRKYQSGDNRSYNLINTLIGNEFDLFNRGTRLWY